MWHLFLSAAALQSPIEYQRRESKSNSLGRNMKSSTVSASGLRPHSSASMDRRHKPCLLAYNTSLPSLHPPQHSPASKVVSVQQHSLAHFCAFVHFSLSDVLSLWFLFLSKFSNPCAATPRVAHPPLSSQLSLHTEVRPGCGTANGVPPCSQHSMQVHQSYFIQWLDFFKYAREMLWTPMLLG